MTAPDQALVHALPLRAGARTLLHIRRRLVRTVVTLEQGLAGRIPDLPPLADRIDGHLVTMLPARHLAPLLARYPRLKPFIRQRYRRSYASLEGDFDDYLAGFSAKSRSTARRKVKKLAERSGGALDLRCYRARGDIEEFQRHAGAVSATTYQERLLDAGLPRGAEALAAMRALAARDEMRGWVLFLEGSPIAYLYAPAEGRTLIYAHLGYDPAFAELSPGTVLQLEAMRRLMDEGRFRLFDFTEGDGRHKRQFATGALDCVDLLLLRPSLANLSVGYGLASFDAAIAFAKRVLAALGGGGLVRRLRR